MNKENLEEILDNKPIWSYFKRAKDKQENRRQIFDQEIMDIQNFINNLKILKEKEIRDKQLRNINLEKEVIKANEELDLYEVELKEADIEIKSLKIKISELLEEIKRCKHIQTIEEAIDESNETDEKDEEDTEKIKDKGGDNINKDKNSKVGIITKKHPKNLIPNNDSRKGKLNNNVELINDNPNKTEKEKENKEYEKNKNRKEELTLEKNKTKNNIKPNIEKNNLRQEFHMI